MDVLVQHSILAVDVKSSVRDECEWFELMIVYLAPHTCAATPNVCLNGGTCVINDVDYLCKCAAGWSGRNCQVAEGMYIVVME
jgi:hypothetical protein